MRLINQLATLRFQTIILPSYVDFEVGDPGTCHHPMWENGPLLNDLFPEFLDGRHGPTKKVPRSSRATLLKTLPQKMNISSCVGVIQHKWLPLTLKFEKLLELLNCADKILLTLTRHN